MFAGFNKQKDIFSKTYVVLFQTINIFGIRWFTHCQTGMMRNNAWTHMRQAGIDLQILIECLEDSNLEMENENTVAYT